MRGSDLIGPEDLLKLEPEEADQLLDRLEARVPVHPALDHIPLGVLTEATVFGDTHGDWRCTLAAAGEFLEQPERRAFIGLGDYIDRPPLDCGQGSVANALYLLQVAAAFPDRVFLVQGNHETHRRIAILPHSLPEEVDQLWGPVESRYVRILHLLERGPLAVTTGSGAYLSHGGFPLEPGPEPFPTEFRSIDDARLAEIVWGETSVGRSHRGFVQPYDEPALERFLARSGTRLVLRGHDPDLTGRPIFHARCLTLHTCRIYERFGGVIVAHLPLDRTVSSSLDLRVDHLETEGKAFEPVD
ncbi:MAG: metallophosphoesterase [Thermoplasmata archaeon]|nr:metallophosphoesterase [Thermoplasmata archaeon]MCI4360019.1 metallophosphoesterase [Thermoplasmata archaeon]